MDKLEALISEALQKFPSEDIRELVARETGLTVEEVSQRMNENAKATGDSFPAATFANIKVSTIDLKQDWTPTLSKLRVIFPAQQLFQLYLMRALKCHRLENPILLLQQVSQKQNLW